MTPLLMASQHTNYIFIVLHKGPGVPVAGRPVRVAVISHQLVFWNASRPTERESRPLKTACSSHTHKSPRDAELRGALGEPREDDPGPRESPVPAGR
ncbi:hypothetical protein NHX12_029323 [Muraenolepis orangiensis]|uniref:Uncharacterized protein n=1 Tax=Muraenolepis orangiensis TaxID=630683 RepID=A0A9Q0EDV3_9TELE|nr:hypothetical protein NHX12_029323 [Muraenolepis orangiensis]